MAENGKKTIKKIDKKIEKQKRTARRVFVTVDAGSFSLTLKAKEVFQVVEGIPHDAKYVGVWHDYRKDTLNFCFEHPSFDPISEGTLIPQKKVVIKHYEYKDEKKK